MYARIGSTEVDSTDSSTHLLRKTAEDCRTSSEYNLSDMGVSTNGGRGFLPVYHKPVNSLRYPMKDRLTWRRGIYLSLFLSVLGIIAVL